MSKYFDQAQELFNKGKKITPREVDHMKTLQALADDEDARKISWLLEGIFQTVGTNPEFEEVL